jgi:hypothetical protein
MQPGPRRDATASAARPATRTGAQRMCSKPGRPMAHCLHGHKESTATGDACAVIAQNHSYCRMRVSMAPAPPASRSAHRQGRRATPRCPRWRVWPRSARENAASHREPSAGALALIAPFTRTAFRGDTKREGAQAAAGAGRKRSRMHTSHAAERRRGWARRAGMAASQPPSALAAARQLQSPACSGPAVTAAAASTHTQAHPELALHRIQPAPGLRHKGRSGCCNPNGAQGCCAGKLRKRCQAVVHSA